MKKAISMILAAFLLLALFAGCGGGASPEKEILGDWTIGETGFTYLSFKNDGTYILGFEELEYKVNKDKSLYMLYSSTIGERTYQWNPEGGKDGWYVSGDSLILEGVTYTRKK